MSSKVSGSFAAVVSSAAERAAANEDRIADHRGAVTRSWALQLALLASVLFWIVAWHWDTARSMAEIWWRSDTFAHGMVVYPISLWLVWRERDRLRNIAASPAYWGMILVAAASFAWLLGDLGGVQAARHFALVTMLALAVWVILGTPIARLIAFPLAFTLTAVPFGEFLLPKLMEHTADFTVGALRLTGIPVYREGYDFVVPSGSWSVIEACSGLRYLIASITLGLLYAYLSYTSLLKRALFVAASVIVPIIGNWIRAYMIVMIGHLSGMKYAVGVDHLIYGWIFFGVVMLALFWLGSLWRDDVVDTARSDDVPATVAARPRLVAGSLLAAVCTALVVTAAPTYSDYLDSAGPPALKAIEAPVAAHGWRESQAGTTKFHPHYVGARAIVQRVYEHEGRHVGLYVAYYAQQREGAEMISSENFLASTRDKSWTQFAQRVVAASAEIPSVIESRLRAMNNDELAVWHWYWTGDDRWLADQRIVKLRQAAGKLLGQGDDGAVVMIYARNERSAKDTDALLRKFWSDMGPAVTVSLAQARQGARAAPADQAGLAH